MKHLKPYDKMNEGYFPYKYEITNEEVEKIYEYFYKWVFPQDKIKLMKEVIHKSIIYCDFLDFYDRVMNLERFNITPYLGVVYSGLGTFGGTLQEMQRSILNNETEYKNYKNKHIIRSSFETIYPSMSFGKIEHGYPYYEYKLTLMVEDEVEINGRLFKKDEITKIITSDYYQSDRSTITRYLAAIIESWARQLDLNLDVSVRNHGPAWRSNCKSCGSFEIRLIDLDFDPPKFE